MAEQIAQSDEASRGSTPWLTVEGGDDLPPDRLERVVHLGQVTTEDLDESVLAGAQAYLVAQGSATTPLPVHFHTVDQFQYFAHGAGTVGRHAVRGRTVHYADALTPYGPLTPGAHGMSYLTLRAVHDGGVRYMPASSSELGDLLARSARGADGRRNVAVALDDPLEPGRWSHLHDDPDGLRISVIELGPGDAAPPLTIGGAGAYAVVVDGAVATADGVRTRDAMRWHVAGDTVQTTAGDGGARVAVLQFPVPALTGPAAD